MTHDPGFGGTSGSVRLLLRIEGAVVLAGSGWAYWWQGGGWLLFVALFLVPDVTMLAYLASRRLGAASYNAGHTYLAPALLALAGAGVGSSPLPLLLALIWTAHIGFDRALGYGLKYPWAFQATHLGWMGAPPKS